MTDLGTALTLGQMVDRAAAQFPARPAVVFKGAFARGKIANFEVPKYVETWTGSH